MESQKDRPDDKPPNDKPDDKPNDKPKDAWSKELGGGKLTFTTEAVGNPIAGYVYEATFERGTSSYSMSRQSTEALTRDEVESRFADFISEIRYGQ
jgi:hypothetical protein